MSNRHKAKFTLTDASNLKSLDIPGLIAKRNCKKHLKGSQDHKSKQSNTEEKHTRNDR